jgi:hypothetical protein
VVQRLDPGAIASGAAQESQAALRQAQTSASSFGTLANIGSQTLFGSNPMSNVFGTDGLLGGLFSGGGDALAGAFADGSLLTCLLTALSPFGV